MSFPMYQKTFMIFYPDMSNFLLWIRIYMRKIVRLIYDYLSKFDAVNSTVNYINRFDLA